MGAKTLRRLIILVVVAATAFVSIFFLQRYQVARMDRSLLSRAERAASGGDEDEALRLYREHLAIEPDDVEAKFSFVKLLEKKKGEQVQALALGTYEDLAKAAPSRDDIRTRYVDLAVKLGDVGRAVPNLEALLRTRKDGHLYFLLGQCLQRLKQPEEAVKAYRSAIENLDRGSAEWIEAYGHMAGVLKSDLQRSDESRAAIEEMAKAAPDNYRVYLEQGRYYHQAGELKEATGYLEQALAKQPNEPEIYKEIAQVATESRDYARAREILDKGLQVFPEDLSLHQAYVQVEMASGSRDRAIDRARKSVQQVPDSIPLHSTLAIHLADRGDTTELRMEIEKLRILGYPENGLQFLEGCLLVNQKDWKEARQKLLKMLASVEFNDVAKSRMQILLARCEGQLGDFEQQKAAYKRALDADPKNGAARQELASNLLSRGDINGAIQEYRRLVDLAPDLRRVLVQLLIANTLKQPLGQRDWSEAEGQVKLLKSRAPDSVEWRIATAQLLMAKGGADVPKQLVDLAKDAPRSDPAARRRLLETLAQFLVRLNDYAAARSTLAEVEKMAPDDLNVQLMLTDLAFLTKDRDEIARRIKRIEAVEGSDKSTSQFIKVRAKLLEAQTAAPDAQKAIRDEARAELARINRPAWAQIPLTLAALDDQELARPGLGADEKRKLQDRAATLYVKAINLGVKDMTTISRATDLLYTLGRSDEVSQFWDKLPSATMTEANPQDRVIIDVINKGDYQAAIKLAIKARDANPDDLLKWIRLAQIYVANKQPEEAEAELRKAIEARPAAPERWNYLIQFLTQTAQLDKAEEAVAKAEKVLKGPSPAGMARCCETLAVACKGGPQSIVDLEKSARWYDEAIRWLNVAHDGRPDDPMISRQLVDLLIRAGRMEDARKLLIALQANLKDPGDATWARRILARTYLVARNADGQQKALKSVEAIEKELDSPSISPDNLRILAEVYESQGTPEYHLKARALIERLVGSNAEAPEDRFLLARMYSKDGDWPKAHDQYRTLMAHTENASDPMSVVRRPDYLVSYIDELIKHAQASQSSQDLNEAQELLGKLKMLRPKELESALLEVQILKAQNQPEKAEQLMPTVVQLIQQRADLVARQRPTAGARADQILASLANIAEGLGQVKLAEDLLRNQVGQSDTPANRLVLAALLTRQGRVKEAFADCEKLWEKGGNPELLAPAMLAIFTVPSMKLDAADSDRFAGLIQKAIDRKAGSTALKIALANLRERQSRYPEAEAIYRTVINQDGGNVIALNNLSWLLALRNEDLTQAIDMINRAIKVQGPIPDLLDTRGVIYSKMGEKDDAIKDLVQATTMAPDSSPKLLHLAEAHLRAGDKDAARHVMSRVKKLTEEDLHPLELDDYKRFNEALGPR
ncbi:tetratricopeptide repeat protein [Aquisphaera insulae]|uniref:tetratricopeptide repeat protein n=1 Tax=Aquisphaera insulae TaxID=2712864 RepID=UPI0013EC9AB3|nr:tetratricopeptide repeat protein [Aquisphaera insulae]